MERRDNMVEFETVKAKEVKFGNNFIEVSRKKVITDRGENEFISIDVLIPFLPMDSF